MTAPARSRSTRRASGRVRPSVGEEDETVRDFAEGQEDHPKQHRGDFAEGQEHHDHADEDPEGDFAEGQKREPRDVAAPGPWRTF